MKQITVKKDKLTLEEASAFPAPRFLRPPVHAPLTPAEMEELKEYFPEVNPGLSPVSGRAIFQMRTPPEKTKGGILLTDADAAYEQYSEQVALCVALGPLAFHFQNSGKPFPEGPWYEVGDFVIIPKFGGYNHQIEQEGRNITFNTRESHEIIGIISSNPVTWKSWLPRGSIRRDYPTN